MISALISRLFILLFGTLYPAYSSYKAVRTKNVKEYVKWMMYWVVFALFTTIETFTDIFLSWFPFYYEAKVVIVVWLLSPVTKGSSTLYRKFVHPMLTRREQEIDEYLNQVKERGYSAVLQLGSKGVNYATNVIMQTAIKYNIFNFDLSRSLLPPPGSENQQQQQQQQHHHHHDQLDGGDFRYTTSYDAMDVEFSDEENYHNVVVREDFELQTISTEDSNDDNEVNAIQQNNNENEGVVGVAATAARTRGVRKSKVTSNDDNVGVGGRRVLRRRRLREPSQNSDIIIE